MKPASAPASAPALPSVSFIVPYYDEAPELVARCLDSVAALGPDVDWELWLVDDGGRAEQVEALVARRGDARVHFFDHGQRRTGPGGPRNAALPRTTKQYVHFLDADDYLFVPQARAALRLAATQRADVLVFGFRPVSGAERQSAPLGAPSVDFCGTGVDYILLRTPRSMACGYFVRRDVVGALRFTPGIFHEDEEFTTALLLRARRVVVTPLAVYAYYRRPSSISRSAQADVVAKRFADLLGILRREAARAAALSGRPAQAARKRHDLLRMAAVYTLVCDAPSAAFLRSTLAALRREGFFPLAPGGYTRLYRLVRLVRTPSLALAARWALRLLRLQRKGRS